MVNPAQGPVVIVGRRHRVIHPTIASSAITLDCQTLLAHPHEHGALLSSAAQVVMLGYFRGTDGEPDLEPSVRLARLVADACKDRSRILYLSTDAVFSGSGGRYRTVDAPAPSSAYGRMKRAQEIELEGSSILRFTVFGPSFGSRPLLSDMIRTLDAPVLYPNAFFSPVSAFAVNDVISRHRSGDVPPGVHHLAGQRVSKAELLLALLRHAGLALPKASRSCEDVRTDLSLEPSSDAFAMALDAELARCAPEPVNEARRTRAAP